MPPETSSRSLERIARERAKLGPEPKVTRWLSPSTAAIFAVAGVFDALRAFFAWLGFLVPALGGVVAGVVASQYLGTWLGTLVGGVVGLGGGVLGGPELEAFGLMMAEALGFAGFFAVLGLLIFKNARGGLFNLLFSFVMGEIPLINGLWPCLTFLVWRTYRRQIRSERQAHVAWQAQNDTLTAQEVQLKLALLERARANAEAAQMLAAANDNEAIPEDERAAA